MAAPLLKSGTLVALPQAARRAWPHRHVVLIGALAAGLVASIGIALDVSRKASLRPPPLVIVAPITRGRVVGTVRADGALVPTQVTLVSQTIPGQLTHVAVKAGEHVSKGQVLARFDPLALRAELARAEARVVGAEVAALEAEIELHRRGLPLPGAGQLGPDDVDELDGPDAIAMGRAARATAEVAASEAAYRVASQRHARGIVRAPNAGVVLQQSGNQGEFLAPGAPLFLIASDPVSLQVEVSIPEAATAQVEVGQQVEFTVPAFPGRRFAARVQRLLPFAGPETARRLPLIIALAETSNVLRARMTASVSIRTSSDRAVVRVPSAALLFSPRGTTQTQEEPGVWVMGEKATELRQVPVQLGAMDGAFTEVRGDGLREGGAVAVGYASAK